MSRYEGNVSGAYKAYQQNQPSAKNEAGLYHPKSIIIQIKIWSLRLEKSLIDHHIEEPDRQPARMCVHRTALGHPL